jgi:hypothetical protein
LFNASLEIAAAEQLEVGRLKIRHDLFRVYLNCGLRPSDCGTILERKLVSGCD